MRRVAAALGVTAMALYHYVADKQALIALVADEIVGEVPEPAPQDGPWYERLRNGFLAVQEEIARYPGLGLYISSSRKGNPSGLRKLKNSVQLLVDAGFDEDEAEDAMYLMLAYQGGYYLFVQNSQQIPLNDKNSDKKYENLYYKSTLNTHRAFVKGLDTIILGFRAQLAAKQVPLTSAQAV